MFTRVAESVTVQVSGNIESVVAWHLLPRVSLTLCVSNEGKGSSDSYMGWSCHSAEELLDDARGVSFFFHCEDHAAALSPIVQTKPADTTLYSSYLEDTLVAFGMNPLVATTQAYDAALVLERLVNLLHETQTSGMNTRESALHAGRRYGSDLTLLAQSLQEVLPMEVR